MTDTSFVEMTEDNNLVEQLSLDSCFNNNLFFPKKTVVLANFIQLTHRLG